VVSTHPHGAERNLPWRDNVTDGGARHAEGDQRRVASARAQYPAGESERVFVLFGGEAADWIDRTVPGANVNSRTREEWIVEFKRLKKLNADLMKLPRAKP
jgi:hypothetical protein